MLAWSMLLPNQMCAGGESSLEQRAACQELFNQTARAVMTWHRVLFARLSHSALFGDDHTVTQLVPPAGELRSAVRTVSQTRCPPLTTCPTNC
jgi:hypothetical protein